MAIDDVAIIATIASSCTAPTTQASLFTSPSQTTTSADISFTRGNGDGGVLVVARQGSAVNADPANNTTYTASSTFESGDEIGTGNYVVYNGSASGASMSTGNLPVTGLSASTTYHFAVYEYNGTAGSECYNLTELPGNATTATPPPSITHTGTSPTSTNINQSSTNNILYQTAVAVTESSATLTQVVATTGGTWAAADLVNFKLRYSTDATLDGADATFATLTSLSGGTGDITFTGSQVIPVGTAYLFITCDVAANATINNTVLAAVDADGDFTYSVAPTYSGSSFAAGNAMTFVGIPEIQLESPVSTSIDCGAAALDFGSMTVGTTATMTVRIRNTGTADLNLTNLPLSFSGGGAADYSITTLPTTPIAPSSFVDMVIQFAPSTTGTRAASLSLQNNDSDENPCGVSFTGVGTLANDNCSGAISLTVYGTETCGGVTNGTTVGATSSGVTGCAGNADDDVWYSFVATSIKHTITVVGTSPLDAVVDLRSGACDGTNVSCADATASGGTEVISASGLTIGVTYFVRIYGYGSGSGFGAFTVCVTTPPPPLYYRSKNTGIWANASTWESSTDNAIWGDATLSPTSEELSITIRDGHTVTVSSSVSIDETTIESGGTLDLTAGTLTIEDGTGTDLTVNGTLQSSSTITATGTIVFNDGSFYNHNFTTSGGVIPTATWNTGSTVQFIGYTTGGPPTGGSLSQTFSNVTYNCTSQSQSTNWVGSAPTAITGTLTIASTNSSQWRLGSTHSPIWVVNNFTQTGGTLNFASSSGDAILRISGNFNQSGGTITESSSGTGTIEFNGSSEQTFTKTSGTITNNIHFVINSGAIVNFGTSVLDGSTGDFTLSSNATLKTANATGIAGTIAVSGSKTFSSAANYEFQGAATGTFTTTPTAATVNNLTINNSGGDVTLGQPMTVAGSLNMTQGRLLLEANNLTASGTIPGFSMGADANSYIVTNGDGALIRPLIAGVPALFPVGLASDDTFNPIQLTNTGAGGSFSVKLDNSVASPSNNLKIINAEWNVTSAVTPIDLALAIQWEQANHASSFNVNDPFVIGHYVGSNWEELSSLVSGMGPYTATVSGFTSLSPFAGANEGALLPVELTAFKAFPEGKANQIEWTAASQLDLQDFILERSPDARTWATLETVKGEGTTLVEKSYTITDPTPFCLTYYRLRAVDFDGQEETFQAKAVSRECGGFTFGSIYPNPAGDEITVEFSLAEEAGADFTLTDVHGKVLAQEKITAQKGLNQKPFSLVGLPAGVYFLSLRTGNEVAVQRVVKQ